MVDDAVRRRFGWRSARAALTGLVVCCLVNACTADDDPGAQRESGTTRPTQDPTSPTHSAVPTRTPPKHKDSSRPTSWGPTQREVARARQVVSRMPARELVGQLFVTGYAGTAPPLDLVRRFHVGGVITMSENITSVADVAAVNDQLQAADDRPWPLVISVDQEGGTVARLGSPLTQFPTYMSLGAADDGRLAQRVAFASGTELRAAGFTMVFAPDSDVTIGPADPTIGSRSAGSRPDLVARTVAASLAGYRRAGIVAVAKHFPGHGSVTANSHLRLPHQHATVATLGDRDLVPFERAVEVGASAVMVGHISVEHVDPGVPADLSAPVTGLLTRRLGFDGLVTTDALNMAAITRLYSPGEAAVAALRAGADILLLPPDLAQSYQGVFDALRSGELTRARLERSATKIAALMLSELRTPTPPEGVWGTHSGLSTQESEAATTVVAGSCGGPYVGDSVRAVGEGWLVDEFDQAAENAGLTTGSGPVVALLTSDSSSSTADIAVSVDTPYVLARTDATTRLALYGWTPEAMSALVAVLTGEADPKGRLPVPIPGLSTSRCG
jgi:beta-N-acetylhexosaminidase